MSMKFYRCLVCKKIVAIVKDGAKDTICCGKPMEEIKPSSTDASKEKHVPIYEVKDNIVHVKVGSEAHPMEDAHYIEWIALETKFGNQRKVLNAGDKPETCFALCDNDEVVNVYAYCNIHGLWKA